MKRSIVRRIGTVLCALAIAVFVWGCGQNTVTGVDQDQLALEPLNGPLPDDGSGGGDGDNNGWW
jgi:hypothetical protein